jgi:hypothetical protein
MKFVATKTAVLRSGSPLSGKPENICSRVGKSALQGTGEWAYGITDWWEKTAGF